MAQRILFVLEERERIHPYQFYYSLCPRMRTEVWQSMDDWPQRIEWVLNV